MRIEDQAKRISFDKRLRNIENALSRLATLEKSCASIKSELDLVRIRAKQSVLKDILDANFKLLNKLHPDLKAAEIVVHNPDGPLTEQKFMFSLQINPDGTSRRVLPATDVPGAGGGDIQPSAVRGRRGRDKVG